MTEPEYERLLKILRISLGILKCSFETDLRVVLIMCPSYVHAFLRNLSAFSMVIFHHFSSIFFLFSI